MEDVGTETNWRMHANPQHSPINKLMERHKQEGNKDMEAGGGSNQKTYRKYLLQQLEHLLLVGF